MGANCANKAKSLGSVAQSGVVLNYEDNEDYYRAKNYENSGKYDTAAEYYQRSLQQNPYSPNAYIGLGNCSFQKGQHQKQDTIKCYTAAIQLDHNAKQAYIGLGNVYAYDQDFNRAVTYYDRAISIDPHCAESYNGLGNLYTFMGDHKSAMKNFSKAAECDPSNGLYWLHLACSQLKRGQNKQGVSSYEKGKSLIQNSDAQLTEGQKHIISTKMNEFDMLMKRNNINYGNNSGDGEGINGRGTANMQAAY